MDENIKEIDRPVVSIIVPCYNSRKYIDDCIHSLLEQTIGIDRMELLFVDDCSTDNTVEVLKQYEKKYPKQIGVILCEKNGRQGTARNIGLQYATGKYVCFVDSDDWIRKDALECLVRIAEESQSEIVQFRYQGKTEYSEDDGMLDNIDYTLYNFDSYEKKRNMLIRSDILNESCTQKLYLRELLLRSNVRFAEGLSYEEPLFTYPLRFFVNKVAVVNKTLYYYRYNESGTTASYMSNPETILEHLQVQQQVIDFVMGLDNIAVFKQEVELYYLHTFFVEPFYFFRYRGLEIPVKLFDMMCNQVRRTVPTYNDNIYFNGSQMQEEKMLLRLIDELDGLNDDEKRMAIIRAQNQLVI